MIVKCSECHHEWQQFSEEPKVCDWCGGTVSVVLDMEEDYMKGTRRWT